MVPPRTEVDTWVQWSQTCTVLWCTEAFSYTPPMLRAPRARWASVLVARNTSALYGSESFPHLIPFSAKAALWVQPNGFYHWASRRHGHHRLHQRPGHPAHLYPRAGPGGPGVTRRRTGVPCHLQKAQQVRCGLQKASISVTKIETLLINSQVFSFLLQQTLNCKTLQTAQDAHLAAKALSTSLCNRNSRGSRKLSGHCRVCLLPQQCHVLEVKLALEDPDSVFCKIKVNQITLVILCCVQ